ncbi:MAG: hypothetical protein H0V66_08305 [Bdellovibrionales bacterium]|nr:hypothetical protein [Bdellovibrionales bacterium]
MRHSLKLLFFFLVCLEAQGSAQICIDHAKNEVQINAHYIFYGDEATNTRATACINEINKLYNNSSQIQLNKTGPWRKIVAKVSFALLSEFYVTQFSNLNSDPKVNFVRIDNPTKDSRVIISEHGLGGNYGYFIVANGLGSSTTCTHEFAHGLGLNHVKNKNKTDCDWRGKGVPPIMAARGCWVDPKFQYDPKVKAGTKGGTINPVHRRVHSSEMSALNLGDLDYRWVSQNKECANIGKAENKVYKKSGAFVTKEPFPY